MTNGTWSDLALIERPTVTVLAAAEQYGRFGIGPLPSSYGITLGNALRRILLSSLPGAAVTKLKLEGVYHEFSTIPGVREDVTELLLQLKGVRVRSFSERPTKAVLVWHGAGVVRAGNLDLPSTIELVNPQHYLCTVDDDTVTLEMELTIERGRGFVRADTREAPAIGEILVDAIFSPIPRVNFVVTEQGETELLTLEIWTDGTIKPGDALSYAAQILAQYGQAVVSFGHPVEEAVAGALVPQIPAEIADVVIEDLGLSTRTYNALRRAGITQVGALLELLKRDRNGLQQVRNLGEKSIEEVLAQLITRGYWNGS